MPFEESVAEEWPQSTEETRKEEGEGNQKKKEKEEKEGEMGVSMKRK